MFDTDTFYAEIRTPAKRWDRYLNVSGDYEEVWCVSSATHALRTHRSQNEVLGIRVFVILFLKIRFEYLPPGLTLRTLYFFFPHYVFVFLLRKKLGLYPYTAFINWSF